MTENSTPNNPGVPEDAVNFEYVIEDVTVNASDQAVVVFRILADGTPVTFNTFAPGGTTLLDGFTGSPSFLVAYTLPQDGVTTPVDYNQLGRSAGQPASVSILNVWNGTQGSLSGPDGSGNYTATLDGSNGAAKFPTGAKMRAVALQGYFTQVSPAVARHTQSVVKEVTDDAVRREVVEQDKCLACHEILELHGGNRVNDPQVCVICHNPNLSSSGRAASKRCSETGNTLCSTDADCPAGEECKYLFSDTDRQHLIDAGYDADNPLSYPEATNNFKELIHGIHAAALRNFPYQFVRDRSGSGLFYYDWSEVTFPGIPSNCETCHKEGTYDADLPAGVLLTTDFTTDGVNATPEGIDAARDSVPNDTDLVNSPTASTCYMCHDSNPAAAHFGHNGGVIDAERAGALGQ